MSGANVLWQKYLEAKDEGLLAELAVRYLPLVRLHAGRLAMGLPSHVNREDLVQSGVLGLMEALQRFDPSRGVSFETFAGRRIRGAMLDELRRLCWLPRSLVSRMRQLDEAHAALAARLGREPAEEELAAEMGLEPAELRKLTAQVNNCALLSLEEALFAIPANPGPETFTLETMAGEEEKERLAAAVEALPERLRLLLSLYYREELTLKEIGMVLGISESRVCQLHARAIAKLRVLLEDEEKKAKWG